MKIAYFDCFSGISGDMVLGALVDAGLSLSFLEDVINRLGLRDCKVVGRKVKRKGVVATKVDVIFPPKSHYRPSEIIKIIENSSLEEKVKKKSKEIFLTLAQAESKIHGESLDSLHMHELSSPDTIIDIVGSVAGIYRIGIDEVFSSKINLGGGKVKTAHGELPVPAPATLEVLKGVPIYSSNVEVELTTPTGAAIIKGFSSSYGLLPEIKIDKVGYGAGQKELSSPNVLRLLIGERVSSFERDYVVVLETNIDDMNPEFYDYIMNSLFEKGALDVFLVPVYMKKNRPGNILTVICEEQNKENILKVIFSETTTLGIRINYAERRKLERKVENFKTSLGEVKVKLGVLNGRVMNFSPEYEDCKKIASEKGLSLRKVYDTVRKEVSSSILSSVFNI